MILRSWLKVVLILIIFSSRVTGQVLHNHPQLSFYNSPSDWPFISAQCHWSPSDAVVPNGSGMLGHTHVEATAPIWSETDSNPITVSFQIQLFHLSGRVISVEGELISKIIWDFTGTETPPIMIGDPMGVKVFTGHVTF